MPRSKSHNSLNSIRERILVSHRLTVGSNGKLTTNLPDDCTGEKSPLMRNIEWRFRTPIEELIWSDSKLNIAKKIEVSPFTVLRWRKKYPLNEYRTGKNNRKQPISKSG